MHGREKTGFSTIGKWVLFITIVLVAVFGCQKHEDPLALNILVSGTVTNASGKTGPVIVEIDYNLKDVADASGGYAIKVHRDYYIDSLYAWVDVDGNDLYSTGEPLGCYCYSGQPLKAHPIHLRNGDVGHLDFTIF